MIDTFHIQGGKPLIGTIKPSGAKNVAMKAIVASLLTKDTVTVKNIPLISSVTGTAEIIKHLHGKINFSKDHSVTIETKDIDKSKLPLEFGGLYRTTTMTMGPLLARFGQATVPNPGGCRLGKRPINMHIEGLKKLGAKINYKNGFFHAQTNGLKGARFKFEKNTHTGTETLILAATLAKGQTILENASSEPEVDDLINMLLSMGAQIERVDGRTLRIQGVPELHGTTYEIMPDRNEVITFAIGAYVTGGNVFIKDINPTFIQAFLEKLNKAGAKYEITQEGIRFISAETYSATDIVTAAHPGFMTDWQQPWAVFALISHGTSTIHETVFESRFAYVEELKKMGAKIDFYHPKIVDPKTYYNFNWSDKKAGDHQAIKITGPQKLHSALVEVHDLRAGATLVLAALAGDGLSVLIGVEQIDRGYEDIVGRLSKLGADIKRIKQ